MPWNETTVVLERTRFVLEAERGEWPIAELCRRYGISRKTGYYWIRRYKEEGLAGLEARSRRPKTSPQATDSEVVSKIVEMRRARPKWGARKILRILSRAQPELELPASSTAHEILRRAGLTKPRRRRGRRRGAHGAGFSPSRAPNDLWTCDYKGEFRLGDGTLCFPLTIQDHASRYLIAIKSRRSTKSAPAREVFEEAFRTYGLPRRMGSDNGPPFSSAAIAGLSRLSVWWLKLGIVIEHIEPGRPEQNGRHERLHRTLLEEEAIPRRPPCADMTEQDERFATFHRDYNEVRPHEALAYATPAEVYEPSWRPYTDETPGLDYPAHFERRQVRRDGCMKWRGELIFVSQVLAGEPVALEEIDDGLWQIYFGPLVLGRIRNGGRRINPGAPPSSPSRDSSSRDSSRRDSSPPAGEE